MGKLSKEQKNNHNRLITVGIFSIFVAAFISINANKFLLSSGLYIGMVAISIFLLLIWHRF